MKEVSLRLDLGEAVKAIKKRKAGLVALQVPEGLKARLAELVEELEKNTNAKVIAFIDPCFGACDLKDSEAKSMGAELLVHLGHTKFIESSALPTVYVPLAYEGIELKGLVPKAVKELKQLNAVRIGLCSTIQFLDYLSLLGEALEAKGFKAVIGKGDGRVEKGQVLGCNYSSVKAAEKEIDAVLYLGDGLFHPLGLSFEVGKPVVIANPVSGEVKKLDEAEKERFLRKRYGLIASARNAKTFGLLVSTKPGQQNIKAALELSKKIEEKGLKAFILAGDLIKPEYVLGLKIDCFVDLACQRIAVDDSMQFCKPLLSVKEAIELLEKI